MRRKACEHYGRGLKFKLCCVSLSRRPEREKETESRRKWGRRGRRALCSGTTNMD